MDNPFDEQPDPTEALPAQWRRRWHPVMDGSTAGATPAIVGPAFGEQLFAQYRVRAVASRAYHRSLNAGGECIDDPSIEPVGQLMSAEEFGEVIAELRRGEWPRILADSEPAGVDTVGRGPADLD